MRISLALVEALDVGRATSELRPQEFSLFLILFALTP